MTNTAEPNNLSHHDPGPEPLSPAAQAVLDAYGHEVGGIAAITSYERCGLAAALRAAAEQPYEVPAHIRGQAYWPFRNGVDADRSRLLAIAAELENR